MKRFRDRYTFACDVAPERLWRAVSDTDALNRDAGLPPVTYRYEPEAGTVAATVAEARLGPFRLVWDEPPFAWEAPSRLAVDRRFRGGPFARLFTEIRIAPHDAGAMLVHEVELETRNALGDLLAPLILARARRGAARAHAAAARRAMMTPPLAPTRLSVPEVPPAGVERVTRFVEALDELVPHAGEDPEIAARLASVVEHADDATVARLRPYVLADAWELPRTRVLGAMLAATRGGLLDLRWTLICPSCRGPKNRVGALGAVGGPVHCDACGVSYEPGFDRNVEVTFDAAPSGRDADPPVYCLAGPHGARQTLAQRALEPGARARLTVTLAPGAYVVQALPDRAARLVVEDDAGAGSFEARIDPRRVALSTSVVRAGSVAIALANGADARALVRITEAELSDQLATAADVTALQAFRDLFSSEVLAEGLELAIRSMTVLFSDIVGSTRMYAESGDARAFRLVREHFDALKAVVAEHRGAIVKTIGDAVMAVFADPRDAVAAALRFEGAVAPLALRVGMHRGPCIAMRANERIDYFGGTVNVASRVGHAAGAHEVLMTAAIADDPRVADVLPAGERGTLALRGIPEPVDVVRVAVPAAALELTA